MANKNNVEVLCQPNGFVRRTIIEEFLGDQTDVIRTTSQNFPVDFFSIDRLSKEHPYAVHAQVKGKFTMIYTRLTELRFNTFWKIYGSKKENCHPCWIQNDTLDFGATFIWKLPENMALWFCNLYSNPMNPTLHQINATDLQAMCHQKLEKVYLIAVKIGSGGFWRLPLCNTYQDAAVCMGDYADISFDRNSKIVPLMERLLNSMTHFRNSPWNHHLREYSKIEDTKAMFSMTIDGKTQVGLPENWEKHCTKINNAFYSDLNLINLSKANV